MKKTLMTCLAVAAVLAVASSAFAITCTVDQRPAATLLVPYFQVSYDTSGNLVSTGPDARDTIFTIANASSSPMIAHVDIWSRESIILLDFDIAMSGFDVQAMRMSDVLGGFLPVTGDTSTGADVCARNASAAVYPSPDGFMRVRPTLTATAGDNFNATTNYAVPAFVDGGALISDLRLNCDGGSDALAIGYVTVDHVNYCNLSNPSDPNYYYRDAIGMENNLWGEIIFTSGSGVPTYGMSTVNIEADASIGAAAEFGTLSARSFYARYWDPTLETSVPPDVCPNCTGAPCAVPADNFLNCNANWDVGFGDQREPLGLRYAARWFNTADITSKFRAWRAGTFVGSGSCTVPLNPAVLTFIDESENGVGQGGGCPSGKCGTASNLFPFESQQVAVTAFTTPSGAAAGWVQFDFAVPAGDPFGQAWVDYSFEGPSAFLNIAVPGTQLDPSTCNPLIVGDPLEVILPVIPAVVGTGT